MTDCKRFLAVLVLALAPVAGIADEFEDLAVTMEVLDSESELDVLLSQMRGPGRSDADRDLGEERARPEEDPNPFESQEFRADDGFDRDNIFRKEPLTEEDDYESLEGEDLDLDLPPPEPEPVDP